MTQHASTSSFRALLIAVALLLASIFASGPAAASTLIPLVDMGSPGGGGGTAAQTVDVADSRTPGVRAF